MPLNGTEIAAYLGAGAWIPQVASWLYRFFSRPRITIIPDKTAEITFTTSGPIFNVTLYINTDRSNALITSIEAELKHTDSSMHKFECCGMRQPISVKKNVQGEIDQTFLDKDLIAIKLDISSPIEKLFLFQEDTFLKYSTNINKFDRDGNGLISQENFSSYMKEMRNFFCWKEGMYTLTFSVGSLGKIKLVPHAYQFSLSSNDINNIKENLTEKNFRQITRHWKWIFPKLSKK